jgi:hypothetical protein
MPPANIYPPNMNLDRKRTAKSQDWKRGGTAVFKSRPNLVDEENQKRKPSSRYDRSLSP